MIKIKNNKKIHINKIIIQNMLKKWNKKITNYKKFLINKIIIQNMLKKWNKNKK